MADRAEEHVGEEAGDLVLGQRAPSVAALRGAAEGAAESASGSSTATVPGEARSAIAAAEARADAAVDAEAFTTTENTPAAVAAVTDLSIQEPARL